MPYKRVWDASCPRVWSEWQEGGVRWLIQDLDPQDDELAVQLLVEHYTPHEAMLKSLECHKDEASIRDMRKFWGSAMARRTSLGCYRCEGGKRELVGVNVCPVRSPDDPPFDPNHWESEKVVRMIKALEYPDKKYDLFKELGVDHYLNGNGLLVVTQWRGRALGKKLLQAREPMCRALGIKATATVFSGPASKREAAASGFALRLDYTMGELRKNGVDLPMPDDYSMHFMIKTYH